MKKSILYLQTLVLLGGSIFAWFTVFGDFERFLGAGYPITQFSGCSVPNPLATPCFYGAIVFLITLGWSVSILLASNGYQKKIKNQKGLNYLLIAGTLFAWGNFGYQLYLFYKPGAGEYIGCSGVAASHPIHTPCFYGAVFYLTALIISIIIIKTHKKI